MLLRSVSRCSILKEFTAQEQLKIFGVKSMKFLHHIDTLYYAVYLNEPKEIVKLQRENNLPPELENFLSCMRNCKVEMRSYSDMPPTFGELEFKLSSFSMYEWCVSLPECFDIFIGSYLPNDDTPRVVVQLRSRYLVLEGPVKAVEESFRYLCEFLSPFGLRPVRVRENRIDYAYHTNIIEDPDEYFDDELLRNHLKTNLRSFSKYGITKGMNVDTLNLGRRTSNNVYFRAYNKSREMIEMNYKGFFIERWYQNGLISEFDKYVYSVAYDKGAYRSGILLGRINWYLEFGHDDEVKKLCNDIKHSDYVNSDNYDNAYLRLHNIIPEPTVIFNIEYQTKRKFFSLCEDFIRYRSDAINHFELVEENHMKLGAGKLSSADPRLHDLLVLIFSTGEVLDYLTGYGNSVSFVKDNNLSLKQFKLQGEEYLFWWKRLRSTKIDYTYLKTKDLYRKYDSKLSLGRCLSLFEGNVARLSILSQESTKERSFIEDLSDILCTINDNDAKRLGTFINLELLHGENGDLREDLNSYDPKDYRMIRERKARQLRGIVGSGKTKENIPEEPSGEKKG